MEKESRTELSIVEQKINQDLATLERFFGIGGLPRMPDSFYEREDANEILSAISKPVKNQAINAIQDIILQLNTINSSIASPDISFEIPYLDIRIRLGAIYTLALDPKNEAIEIFEFFKNSPEMQRFLCGDMHFSYQNFFFL